MSLGERIAAAVANEVHDTTGDLHPVVTQTIARIVDAECWPKPDPSTNTTNAMRAALRVLDVLHPIQVDATTELRIATVIDHEYKHASGNLLSLDLELVDLLYHATSGDDTNWSDRREHMLRKYGRM